jgi:UDP-N-acetylmuramate--alanine ligase
VADLPQAIWDSAREGDVVLCMGAGSIGAVPGKVLELLQISEQLVLEGQGR